MTYNNNVRNKKVEKDIGMARNGKTFNQGATTILNEYLRTQEKINGKTLVLEMTFGYTTKESLSQAIEYLETVEIKEVIITNRSTALMETLLEFTKAGWTVEGPEVVKHKEKWGEAKVEEGLKLIK